MLSLDSAALIKLVLNSTNVVGPVHFPGFNNFVFIIFPSKPLVCLFPPLFKQNLLTFLYLVRSAIPQSHTLKLLKCLSQDSNPSPWVIALSRQLERKLEMNHKDPLYSEQCSQKLKKLSEHLGDRSETGGWADCFNNRTEESESLPRPDLPEHGTQRKRRARFDHVAAEDVEMVQESKRLKMDMDVDEPVDTELQKVRTGTQGGSERAAGAPADGLNDGLPEHLRVNRLRGQAGFFLSILKCIFVDAVSLCL